MTKQTSHLVIDTACPVDGHSCDRVDALIAEHEAARMPSRLERFKAFMERLNPGPYILASPIGWPFQKLLDGWHKYQENKRRAQHAEEGRDE